MRAECDRTWERADSFVDRQISRERLHVWPFGGSYPIDVRCLILDRRHDVPVHRPDHLEVVIFESGKLGYEVEDDCCEVGKNDIIVVGDRIRHRCLPLTASQTEARTVVLSFLPQTVHQGAPVGDDFQYLMPFSTYGAVVPNVIRARAGLTREILDLVERIRREMPAETEHSRLAIRTYLKMILLVLVGHCSEYREARLEFSKQRESRERLAPVFEHLQQHYDEPIRVTDAARLCAVSSCCFMSIFKEVTGQSFVAYLNGYRVAKAQGMLSTTDKPISEISLESGFCTQSYFGMVFRRVTGITPLAYRLQSMGTDGETVRPQ
ncbi:MAG TPA: AraC family transcriptional regulator [Terriglobales bacterium]|nr:AraC family transcriptional regulator [Terriglobales bacterium]